MDSLLLVFEEPAFLLHHKEERGFSFATAVVFDILYLIAGWKLYFMLFKEDKVDFNDWNFLLEAFFFAYNLVMSAPLAYVNLVIIIKELLIENFQLLSNQVSGKGHDYSLGKADAMAGLNDLLWFFNPFSWVDIIWELFFGYDVEDYWSENPNDEQHYYKNW